MLVIQQEKKREPRIAYRTSNAWRKTSKIQQRRIQDKSNSIEAIYWKHAFIKQNQLILRKFNLKEVSGG
jgi:hypothetical protein